MALPVSVDEGEVTIATSANDTSRITVPALVSGGGNRVIPVGEQDRTGARQGCPRCWTAAQRERQPVGERDRKDDGARVVGRRRNEGGTRAIPGGELD